MTTFHCMKCGATNLPNQLGHLKECDLENYVKSIGLMNAIDIIMTNIERLEDDLTIKRANINKKELELERLKKDANQ